MGTGGFLPEFNLPQMGDVSSSFDEKVGSSAPESCSQPEKWASRCSSYSNMYTQNLVIDVQDSEHKKKTREKPTKKQPIWMLQSTVEGATRTANNSVGKFFSKYFKFGSLTAFKHSFPIENIVSLV